MNSSELSVRGNRNGVSCLHISVDCRINDVKVKHWSRDASASSPNALSHHVFKLFVFMPDLVVVFPHFWHIDPFVWYDYSNFQDNSPFVWRRSPSLAIFLECRCSFLKIFILCRLILAFWHFLSAKKKITWISYQTVFRSGWFTFSVDMRQFQWYYWIQEVVSRRLGSSVMANKLLRTSE